MSAETGVLDGRVALVTGAGRGIGRSLAIGLAEMGAKVALLSRSANELDEVAGVITAQGGVAITAVADVSNPDQRASTLDRVTAQLGAIDILINNAAVVWPVAASTTVDITDYATALDINVIAVVALSFALLPNMLEQHWGRIINISSGIAARPQGMIGANAYATSKAALEAHTINLAAELSGTGVAINAYRPGGVDTAMQSWIRAQSPTQVGEALHTRFVANFEGGTLLSADESAAGLLSRIPSDASGEIWSVDDH